LRVDNCGRDVRYGTVILPVVWGAGVD
jgi:hypothetical protein